MKTLFKWFMRAVSIVLMLPAAVLAGFGRFTQGFIVVSHAVAMAPGLPGDYLRNAFYSMTLRRCGAASRISFGTIFSTADVVLEDKVYVGSYCVIGRARIGRNSQIASHVQIPSGRRQHTRDEEGNILGGEIGEFTPVVIGANSWIGASAVVMADVGEGTTVGAGSIVTKPLPGRVVAAGNPARVMRALDGRAVSQ